MEGDEEKEREREGGREGGGSFCEHFEDPLSLSLFLSLQPFNRSPKTVNRREFEFKTDSTEIPDPAPSSLYSAESVCLDPERLLGI